MHRLSRRAILIGGLGLGAGALTGCSTNGAAGFGSSTFGPAAPVTPSPGQKVVVKSLVAKPTTLDLGGPKVATWAYGDTVPGPLIRATAGPKHGRTSRSLCFDLILCEACVVTRPLQATECGAVTGITEDSGNQLVRLINSQYR